MFYILSPEAGTVLGLILIALLAYMFLKAFFRKPAGSGRGIRSIAAGSPFLELDVTPVSEGDEVCHAYRLDGRYAARIENRHKNARLDVEAGSKEELERMVQDAFRAWSVSGRKKPCS